MATKKNMKQMKQALKEWMTDPDNNAHRFVSQTKLKEMMKAIDPDIRMDKKVHLAACRELGLQVIKGMARCYDNKRVTVRASDL